MIRHAVAALLALLAIPAHADTVALTFDDLPVFGRPASTADAARITRKLLRGLNARHLPAIGFVNEIKLEASDKPARIALLRAWLDAGEDLGNHSYSHKSLTAIPVDAYIADVARGDAVTRALLAERGRVPHWFRHPYLETGPTLAVRTTFETWLGDHGYRVAPVTMENADWEFAMPYDAAVLGRRPAEARRIRREYLKLTRAIVPWHQAAADAVLGRRPAFIFLLHASRLNADSIGAIAGILRRNHLQATTLDAAMADPAYAIPDTYAGPDGNDWLERWGQTLGRELPWSTLPETPQDIAAESARLEAIPASAAFR